MHPGLDCCLFCCVHRLCVRVCVCVHVFTGFLALFLFSWFSLCVCVCVCVHVGMVVMRALHTVRRVCAMSPWDAEHTMRAAYAVGHHLLCAWEHACQKSFHWLKANAVIRDDFWPQGYAPVWCHDVGLLRRLVTHTCQPQTCVCVLLGGSTQHGSNCMAFGRHNTSSDLVWSGGE